MNPLVSCICVTRNRREWLPKAIRHFQAQTYPNRELLILADGESVADLVPADGRIRLIQAALDNPEPINVGDKRNAAVAMSQGEVIAHWDDDDYSAPARLEDQVRRLQETGKAVTGYSSMYFTDGPQWWLYKHFEPYTIGTSLCYRKNWAVRNPFEPIRKVGMSIVHEDGVFFAHANRSKQVVSCAGDSLMVASIHDGNTSPRRVNNPPEWRSVDRPNGVRSPFD